MSSFFVMVPTVIWCACPLCVTLEVVGKNAVEPDESVAASHNFRGSSQYAVVKFYFILNLLFTILLLFSFTNSKIIIFFKYIYIYIILMCVHTRERGSSPGFVGI